MLSIVGEREQANSLVVYADAMVSNTTPVVHSQRGAVYSIITHHAFMHSNAVYTSTSNVEYRNGIKAKETRWGCLVLKLYSDIGYM